MRIFEQIFLQTRQKFAGILGVWQEFLTQYAAKFAEKTQADAYAHKLLFSPALGTAASAARRELECEKLLTGFRSLSSCCYPV